MSVLTGEGSVPILFGTTSINVGTMTHIGYLARPDLTGEWPTVVVVAGEWGVTSSVKDLCRRLARHGFAAVAPDLYRGRGPARAATDEEAAEAAQTLPESRVGGDLAAIVDFIANPAGFWSNAERGFGVLGLGEGARFAVRLAVGRAGTPLALVAPRLRAPEPEVDYEGNAGPRLSYPLDELGDVAGPVLGLSGREDAATPVDDVMAARDVAPQAEWVLYDGVGSHFVDDYLEGYDGVAFADALERLVAFFETHLPAVD